MGENQTPAARWLLLAAAVVLAGCSGGDGEREAVGETAPSIVQPGAPGEPSRTIGPDELDDLEPTPHTEADVLFMQRMIHHHAQALRMTSLVRARSERRDVALLARRMDISQEGEIELMERWLEARGEAAPELHRQHGHAHGAGQVPAPGMLTERELDRLEAARGARFDLLFLEFMIRHHQGAVRMVAELFGGGSGGEPEVGAFARHVDTDQRIEIRRMRELLRRVDAPRRAGAQG